MAAADLAATEALVNDTPWSEKYRPKTLDEVASHGDIVTTLKELSESDQLPHLLFYGPPGTGKTSTCLALARSIFGGHIPPSSVLELNASDDRGIGIVRGEIKEFASTRTPFARGPKIIVLDECDAMTRDAQMALRRVMEKYVRNVRFCLICNYVGKVIPALQSRCTRFRFKPLPRTVVRQRLEEICEAEAISRTEEGIQAVMELGEGDMRRTLNLLQAVSMSAEGDRRAGRDAGGVPPAASREPSSAGPASAPASREPSSPGPASAPASPSPGPQVTLERAYACAGKPLPAEVQLAAECLLNDTLSESFSKLRALQLDRGVALVDLLTAIHPFVFKIGMPAGVRADLVAELANVEWQLSTGTNEALQLGAVVGAFARARAGIVAAAK